MCDPCRARTRSTSASYWCPFCHEAFCKVCCQFHQTMKLTRTHKVQTLDAVSSAEKQRYGAGTGSNYVLQSLTSATFNDKTQLREIDNILLLMDGLSDTALTLKKMFFDMKMKIEAEKNECMRKVVIFKERLKQLADDFERHISGELDYLQHAENMQIESRIEECENSFNAIEMSKDLTQCMKTERITQQTIGKVNAARQRCNEYKFALQRIHSHLQPVRFDLAIDRNINDALNTSPSIIGKVEVNRENDEFDEVRASVASRDTHKSSGKGSGNTTRMSNVTTMSTQRHKPLRFDSETPMKVTDLYLQRKDDNDEPMITSICTMNNNHFLTLDRNNNKILLVHQDGVIVTSYVFTSQIWDMAMIDNLTVAVTVPDNDKIVLVKVRNKNLCAERLIKTSNICYGVCSIEGFIVVTVKGGYVKILTKAGEEMASIRHNSHGEILFTDPQHVATNREKDEIYVTDYTQHTLTALFLNGFKIDSSPKFVFRANELRNPTGLCLDRFGNVYVCGYSSHNVIKITPEGNLLAVFLTGVMNPQTVALTTMEDTLMVSVLSSAFKQAQNVIEIYQL
ncbi:hypothetical protein ACF0H5_019160 [Mactra antiquata]